MKTNPPFTVLLVEDHEDSREAIKHWLEWKSWHVLTASGQKSALALARQHSVAVLICDQQLPDGNGWDLMKQLSAIKPVQGIMISGHCAPADVARSKAAGFLDHLVKPCPVEELEAWLDRIRRELEKQAASPSALEPPPPRNPNDRRAR